MTPRRPSSDRPSDAQRVRFSFEAMRLRQAADAAAELRRVTPNGVRVRPTRLTHAGPYRWTIDVTTGPLHVSAIAVLEEELRWFARRGLGVRFAGWVYLSGPVEPPAGERAATA